MGGEHDQLTSFSNSACLSTAAMHFLHTPSFFAENFEKRPKFTVFTKNSFKNTAREIMLLQSCCLFMPYWVCSVTGGT